MRTSSIPFLTLAAVAALATGCADDGDDGAGGSISTRGQWCDVAQEVDDQFTEADSGDLEFAAAQTVYADIVEDIERLEGGLEHVDEDARDSVEEALGGAKSIADFLAEAQDEAAASDGIEEIFAESAQPDEEAVAWISDNCDVDIDS